MPARNYLTDPKQLLAQGQMIVSSTEDSRFQHKVECVNLVLGGADDAIGDEQICRREQEHDNHVGQDS